MAAYRTGSSESVVVALRQQQPEHVVGLVESSWSVPPRGDDVGNDMAEFGQAVSQLAVRPGRDPHRHGMGCQPAAEELVVD